MNDESAVPASAEPPRSQPEAPPDAGHVPITEEMDSARWTLPPVVPLLVALGIVAVLVTAFALGTRSKPGAEGAVMRAEAVELAGGQNVLVLVQMRMANLADKPLWIQNIKVRVETPDAQHEDEPSAATEHDRYLAAFPQLAEFRMAPVRSEDKIASGDSQEGMIIVGFPVSKAAFDQRTALHVIVQPYDRKPLTLEEKR